MPGLNDWLAKAAGDLKVAKLISKDEDVLDIAAYHTHQCVEKALKTYLIFCKFPILKSHDLEKILELCAKKDQTFKILLDDVLMLSHYGTYSRYPDDRFSINKNEVAKAIIKATKILNFVKKKIEKSTNQTIELFEE